MTNDEVGRIYTWNGRYLLVVDAYFHNPSTRPPDTHAIPYYMVMDMEDGMMCEVSRKRALLVFRRIA